MKRTTNTKNIVNVKKSYKNTMRDYYFTLKKDAPSQYSTSRLLQELGSLLDRCMLLESPKREQTFVEEVCRMERKFHIAA